MSPSRPSRKLGVETWEGVRQKASGLWETWQRQGHHPESMGVRERFLDCPTLSSSPLPTWLWASGGQEFTFR